MADDPTKNPYIRTYASDVAALGGKPPPAEPKVVSPSPAPSATPSPAPSPAPAETPAPVAAPAVAPPTQAEVAAEKEEADRAAVLERLRERAAKDPVHKSELLPTSLPTPTPVAEPTPDILPGVVTPDTVAQAPAVPEAVHVAEDTSRMSVMPQTPIAPTATEAPAPLEPLSNLPPPPPAPVAQAQPPAEPAPRPPVLASSSPLHTYTSDFADRIDSKGASAFSVLAAQSDAGALTSPTSAPKSHGTRTLIITIAGILLIAAGGVGVFAAYQYVSTHGVVSVAPSVPSLVFADEREALTGEGPQLLGALASSAEKPLGDGKVRVVYLTQSSTTPTGGTVTIPLTGGRLVGSLQLQAPDILLRNVAPESTVGIVHAGPETRAFFLLKVLSYERTCAGMLQWEGTIGAALSALYPQYAAPPTPEPTIATTTIIVKGKRVVATTTVPAAPVVTVAPRFIDEIASNHDVRALKDGQGRTILLYGYKDKETLVIARDEAAFAELLNRLGATRQQ